MKPVSDEAFTLTEVLASLVLAGLLMIGLMELGGQGVRSGARILADLNESKSLRALATGMERASRALPEDLETSQEGFIADIGSTSRVLVDSNSAQGDKTLTVVFERGALQTGALRTRQRGALNFEMRDGHLHAYNVPAGDLVTRVALIRGAPHDCRYDPVAGQCR